MVVPPPCRTLTFDPLAFERASPFERALPLHRLMALPLLATLPFLMPADLLAALKLLMPADFFATLPFGAFMRAVTCESRRGNTDGQDGRDHGGDQFRFHGQSPLPLPEERKNRLWQRKALKCDADRAGA
jgi:hypothetical protein